ncbi:hypothetical protein Poli38472_012390 [Pythium oligandrum]|uniref:Uncharacterized protein n=1 Tax=Pythium oligandrum TaxID=41045 RepID=A0A8K1FNF7_PYTOL|nr:hypothetical protein Poli38472_012390 [Pythium oligandrum]|eukprot:TMW67274.1 hypothetical protein Poli38472_012390 [Pythium oligandrum]
MMCMGKVLVGPTATWSKIEKKMKTKNPLTDILVGLTLGTAAALAWNNYKKEYFDRIDTFYREMERKKKKSKASEKRHDE